MKKTVNSISNLLNEGCNDSFICNNRDKGKQLTFIQFRKYIAKKFKNELKTIPYLYEDITDYSTESLAVTKLYQDIFTDFIYDLDSANYSKDIEENLKDYYIHDYLIEMQ